MSVRLGMFSGTNVSSGEAMSTLKQRRSFHGYQISEKRHPQRTRKGSCFGLQARFLASTLGMTVLCIVCWSTSACADEGMWLPDHPPTRILKEKYHFEPSPQWLEHAQKSTVSFGYATGSFVSRDGLILTNHH